MVVWKKYVFNRVQILLIKGIPSGQRCSLCNSEKRPRGTPIKDFKTEWETKKGYTEVQTQIKTMRETYKNLFQNSSSRHSYNLKAVKLCLVSI